MVMFVFLEETKYIPDPEEPIVMPVSNREDRSSVAAGQGGIAPVLAHNEKSEKPEKSHPDSSNSEGIHRGSVVSVRYDVEETEAKQRLVNVDRSIPIRSWRRRYALFTTNGSQSSTYEWWRHLTQPFVLIATFPGVAFAALQWAFCLSALSLVAVATSDLFSVPPYNFSAVGIGNMNIPPAIGQILGTIYGGPCVDWALIKLSKRNGGIYEPEMRLTLFVLPAILMPVGVFMYGLCTAEGRPWIIPAVGSAFIGFAIGGEKSLCV